MALPVLSIRMDEKVKQDFPVFCDELGISVSAAVNLFARQTLRERRIPFEVTLNESLQDTGKPIRLVEIKHAVSRAASEFASIDRVVLFGSYARGEATSESDIDLRVMYDEGSRVTMMNLAAFSNNISITLGCDVDVVSKRSLDEDLETAIQKEGIIIYERQTV